MGMSTHVVGIRPPDDTWRAMKAVYDACEAANIQSPAEVNRFFGYEEPDDAGVIVPLNSHHDGGTNIVRQYATDMALGIEIDIADLPEHITTIRFFNSW